MKKTRLGLIPYWRSLPLQLYIITVLPLTVLLLVIAFGGVALHQDDMRALVGERDERAIRSAAATLESELHHRMATVTNLAILAGSADELEFEKILQTDDFAADFDGGYAFIDSNGILIDFTNSPTGAEQLEFWKWIAGNVQELSLAAGSNLVSPSAANPLAAISKPFLDPISNRLFVVISAYSAVRGVTAVGAFLPNEMAAQAFAESFPADQQITLYLLDSSRQPLYVSNTSAAATLPADHPGVAEALRGESGTSYIQIDDAEHVIAYSPIPSTGWALITEEDWEAVISPSLQATQIAPLVLVPAFILALVALWFGARQIVRPLQRLESKAAALAWGDFEAIRDPVGGISEVRHLQMELAEMARKVESAQEGLHDYIGAITSAQEEERLRLARELHDDTIQSVIALKQRVGLSLKSVRDHTARELLMELEALAEQTIENLRRLTRALRPIYLEDLGLATALEMLARETSQSDPLEVEFNRSGTERRLPPEVELALYRIAQEALNNIVHHAQANRAGINITFGKEIELEVMDDGIGFDVPKSPTAFAPGGHFGLLGMRERADLIGARLNVQSEAGGGTRLSLRLAIPPTKSQKAKQDG
jgi:signal transduction histidine kinase